MTRLAALLLALAACSGDAMVSRAQTRTACLSIPGAVWRTERVGAACAGFHPCRRYRRSACFLERRSP